MAGYRVNFTFYFDFITHNMTKVFEKGSLCSDVFCSELLSKGRQWVAAWRTTGRLSWRGGPRRSDANRATDDCSGLGLTVRSSIVLAVLLVIGGAEQNPGPGMEGKTPYNSYVLDAAGT
jgi:hypothetical protein